MSDESENRTQYASENESRVLEIPLVQHENATPDTKSDDSIASEARTKDPEFEMLNSPDLDDAMSESVPLTKSGASSLGSFTEVTSLADAPGVEMTTEHSDVTKLLHEAGKESGESSTEADEHSPSPEIETNKAGNGQSESGLECVQTALENREDSLSNEEECKGNLKDVLTEGDCPTEKGLYEVLRQENVEKDSRLADGEMKVPMPDHGFDASDGKPRQKRDDSLADFSQIEDDDVVLFSNITYLGSSTVNAPVSDVELKKTMAILKQQTRVAIDIVLSVGTSFNGAVKLLDPRNKTVIAMYELQKILFCGRGDDDGNEADCFAFNTCHGNSDIFHSHVFRCLENAAVSVTLLVSVSPYLSSLKADRKPIMFSF